MPFTESPSSQETLTRGDRLGDQVYKWLAATIMAGTFAPGDRINIRRLSAELNSSVTPVREAVLRLIAEGVLDTTNTSAIIVPERTESEIREVFEVRRVLEGEMAFAAADNITQADVDKLIAVHKQFLSALDKSDYREVLRQNSIFHFSIYRRSERPLRLKITETLWLRIGPTLRYMYPFLQDGRENHKRHENIIEAAAKRNREELRLAILADLASSESALQQHLNEPTPPKRRLRQKIG